MFSMPPATITLASPARIAAAPIITALRPEPQTLLMVVAPTPSGRPALSAAWRAGACPAPAWITCPISTSSTRSGAMPARSTAARMAVAPSSVAGTVERPPPNLPMGVRAADRMKTSLMRPWYAALLRRRPSLLLDAVEQVGHLVGPALLDDAQLDLQGGGQLTLLLGQQARQERDPPGALEDGEAVELGLDLGVDQLLDRLLLDQLLRRHLGQPVGGGPGADLLEVRGEQRAGVGLIVAQDHRLRDVSAGEQRDLHGGGRHVLAVGQHDDVLQPIRDPDAADLVELADVAGVEPAIGIDDPGRLRLIVQIALHDLRPARQDLPRLAVDADLGLGYRPPDRSELELGGAVDGEQGRRLGQAVALQDQHAHGVEELADLPAQRGAAGDEVAHPPAGALADAVEDEPIGQPHLGAQPGRVPLAVEVVLVVAPPEALGPVEDALPQRRRSLHG